MSVSPFKAAAFLKCPQCGKGNLFSTANPYNIKKFTDMPDHCPECGLSFMPEPGFYYGAMYVSYALTIALSVFNFIWVYMLWGFVVVPYLIINSVLLILLLPIFFRYGRSYYLALVYKIEKTANRRKKL